ncbi:MAG: hypothetical protein RLZZ400_500 [Actinomycetota bacterium]|jgi:hypothetical protein
MSGSGNKNTDAPTILGCGGCAVGLLIGIWPIIAAGGSMSESGPGAVLWLLPMSLIGGGIFGIVALIIANAFKNR